MINWARKTDIPYWDNLLKNKRAVILNIEPLDYLKRCYELQVKDKKFSFKEYIDILIDKKLAKKYADLMNDGNIFYLPVIDYVLGEQEGRHRAYASIILRQKTIPVLIRRD